MAPVPQSRLEMRCIHDKPISLDDNEAITYAYPEILLGTRQTQREGIGIVKAY